jgi:hypothetical protein
VHSDQQEINKNTHFKEHGKYYFDHYYKEDTAKMKSSTPGLLPQLGVLLFSDFPTVPPPLLCAIRSNYSRAIVAMHPITSEPQLCSIWFYPGWAIVSVYLVVPSPNLRAIRLNLSWAALSV